MKAKNILISACMGIGLNLMVAAGPAMADPPPRNMVSEARSVIEGIKDKSADLTGEITEFHREFATRAAAMVKLEEAGEELKAKGYLGAKYADSPQSYERFYAEYAKQVKAMKDIFKAHYAKIQRASAAFQTTIYKGKDRITELRSDDLAVVRVELGRAKQDYEQWKSQKADLEDTCPAGEKNPSRSCLRKQRKLNMDMRRIYNNLERLKFTNKVAKIKKSIGDKLGRIMDQYVYKEEDTVNTLLDYINRFEQYASFIASKDLGGILRTFKDLRKMEEAMKDMVKFQDFLAVHVSDIGNLVNDRTEQFINETGIQMESRGELLAQYPDSNQVEDLIQQIEKESR